MITNKDLSIDSENGKIILNGDKYDLGTQGEIDTAVKDIYSVMGQMGAKNLIPYPYTSNSYSQKGIDFTCLSDGTINANGTNDGTGNSTYFFVNNFTLSKGTYVLNGCPTQTGSNYRCGVARASDSGTIAFEQGSGAKFTLDADIQVRFYVQVFSGKTADNITFKPMLRLAADTDNTYEPYAMTNKQLTEQVEEVKGTIGDITQTGVTGDNVAEQLSQLNAEIDVINSKLTRVELNITSLEASSWTESSVSGLYFTRIALPVEYYGRFLISAILRKKYSGDDYIFIGNYNNFDTSDKDIMIFSVTNNPRAIVLDLYYEAAQNN